MLVCTSLPYPRLQPHMPVQHFFCRFCGGWHRLGLENDRYGGVFVVVLGFLTVWAYFDDKRITPDRAEDMKRRQREIAENRLPKVKR